ncbi:mitochondrial ribonuclease P catalytic subunit [Aulostomus maculatus]
MSCRLMLKLRIYLNPLFGREFLAVPALLPSARSLCSRHSGGSGPGVGRAAGADNSRTGGQAGLSEGFSRQVTGERRVREGIRWSGANRSVFNAGTAKRTKELMELKRPTSKEEEGPTRSQHQGRELAPDRPLSVEEWRSLKESSYHPASFEIRMLKNMQPSVTGLSVAKSLLTFVATETGTLTYELLLNYSVLCLSGGHDTEMCDVYDLMKGIYPIFDPSVSGLFVKGLSRTSRWREAIGVLNNWKKLLPPSSSSYGSIISAAMQNGASKTAWALYDELLEQGLSPRQQTWESLFNRWREGRRSEEVEAMSQEKHHEKLLKILHYMRDNQVYPQLSLANSIKDWFESLQGQKWTGHWTHHNANGFCRCCGKELESILLSEDEYEQLKHHILTDIIQGQDTFRRTTPKELNEFKSFVARRPPFDVVVDGLNVCALSTNKHLNFSTLLTVVSALSQQGMTVLVLGRRHMIRQYKLLGNQSHQPNIYWFFTENISEDDPFLLYATLNSGNHCKFLTRDLMRDHKACLADETIRRLFFKWQRGHQLVVHGRVTGGGKITLMRIPRHDTIIQTSGDSWHIPYDDNEHRSIYEVPQKWLCLTRAH